jgi:hypothetical protein
MTNKVYVWLHVGVDFGLDWYESELNSPESFYHALKILNFEFFW